MLSKLQPLGFDGVKTRVLLSDFAQRLRCETQRFTKFNLLYQTMLAYLKFWLWNKTPKSQRDETGSPSKYECQKMQSSQKQDGAAFGSVCSLVKTSYRPVSKVTHFLHLKTYINYCNTKLTLATRNFKRMKVFSKEGEDFGVWIWQLLKN